MSKSIKKKLVALMVAGIMALPMAAFGQDQPVLISENEGQVISEQVELKNEMMVYMGKISQVIKNDGNISILVNTGDKDQLDEQVFHIGPGVSLWEQETEKMIKGEELKEGMDVQVFLHENTPTTMSIPPQSTPRVVVVSKQESAKSTYVGKFNHQLVSTDNYLQLNIGEDTIITNEKGDQLDKEDIFNKTALVFYGVSTRSIPAQTTPSTVVVLTEEDNAVEDQEEMISLRDAATALGYKVEWNNEDKTAQLTKMNQSILVKLGSVDYTLNKSLGKFTKAPELRNSTLYVPASILELIK